VKLAWELANHVLIRSLDDVQTQTRRLLLLIDKMVTAECQRLEIERMDYRFTRATVRQFSGWSDSQLKTHLHRLEELEYVALHRGAPGQSFVYALNFEMDESGRPVLPGLSYGAKRDGNRSGFSDGVSGFEGQRSGSSLGQVWGVSGGGASEQSPVMAQVPGSFQTKNGKHRSGADAARILATDAAVVIPKPNGAVREGPGSPRTGLSPWGGEGVR
jgi:DNA primase